MEEARRLGDKYAPEEMKRRSIQTFRPITTPVKLPQVLESSAAELIKLAKDNMDKFDKDEKERVNFFINSLEDKYDKNTSTALRLELHRKGLFRVGKGD